MLAHAAYEVDDVHHSLAHAYVNIPTTKHDYCTCQSQFDLRPRRNFAHKYLVKAKLNIVEVTEEAAASAAEGIVDERRLLVDGLESFSLYEFLVCAKTAAHLRGQLARVEDYTGKHAEENSGLT